MANVILGDCLDQMKSIPDETIDFILTDLPYGMISSKWDSVIPLKPLWEEYIRVIKPNSAIALFGAEPFSSKLRNSNLEMFKYDWIWNKVIPSGMMFAKHQPMRQHEIISIFAKGKAPYYPQMVLRDKPIKEGGKKPSESANTLTGFKHMGGKVYTHKYPMSILTFDKIRKGSRHPTEKPVPLLEYLIKTYTIEGALVLDSCAGSGSTGEAARNLGRDFILIEKEEKYFTGIKERLSL